MKYITYIHHNKTVFVREDLKGKHKEFCLCHKCNKFHPHSTINCTIAEAVFENCLKYGVVTPMWECPKFNSNKIEIIMD